MAYLRKRPRQARAQATFDAIVEAAARILAEDGGLRLTTNRIAARAGVSVGSLYQYFPERRAIVRALLEREVLRAESLRPPAIDDQTRPLAERVRLVVDWHFDVHAAHPALAKALRKIARDAVPNEEVRRFARLRTSRVAGTLASLGVPTADVATAATVVDTCLDALTDAATARNPAWLRSQVFRRHVVALIRSYLESVCRPD
jgi:AcrR family transcriptional regulator